MSQSWALVFAITAMLSVQLGAASAKQLFLVLGPELTTFLRVGLSAIILNLVFRPWRAKWNRRALKAVALYGLALGAMNFLFYLALNRIPLGVAVAVEFIGPLGIAVFHSRRRLDLVWALVAAVGIFLFTPWSVTLYGNGGQSFAQNLLIDPVGLFEAMAAGFFWGLYIVFGKLTGVDHSHQSETNEHMTPHGAMSAAIGMAFAALVPLFAVSFSFSHFTNVLADVPMTFSLAWMALLVAVLSSALPYSLEILALKNIPIQLFGILMSVEPAIGAVVGRVFLREVLSRQQLVAGALVIIASLGSGLSAREPNDHGPNNVRGGGNSQGENDQPPDQPIVAIN